jgi:hypothetical protein
VYLAPRQTPKLEDHLLSAVRDCLFNILASNLHTWRSSPPSANRGRAVPWWQVTRITWGVITLPSSFWKRKYMYKSRLMWPPFCLCLLCHPQQLQNVKRVGISAHTLGRKQIQFPKRSVLNNRTMDTVQKPSNSEGQLWCNAYCRQLHGFWTRYAFQLFSRSFTKWLQVSLILPPSSACPTPSKANEHHLPRNGDQDNAPTDSKWQDRY